MAVGGGLVPVPGPEPYPRSVQHQADRKARSGAEASGRDDVQRCVDVPEVRVPARAPVDDAEQYADAQQGARAPPCPVVENRYGRRGGPRPGPSQPGHGEPGEHGQCHRGTAVLHALEHRKAADVLIEDRYQPGAPPVVMGERVPHDVRARPDDRRHDEPRTVPHSPRALPLSAYEGVHAPLPRSRQQRHQRFAQQQPQRHHGRGDKDVHREHAPHGMRDLTELHGARDGRIRVVRHVGGERTRDERRSEERAARGAVASDDRQYGSGMAEGERHGRKYARALSCGSDGHPTPAVQLAVRNVKYQ